MSDEIKTVEELLKAAEEKPELLYRAHRNVWRAISAPIADKKLEILSEPSDKDPDAVRRRRMFHDQPAQRKRYPLFANELFGIDPNIAETAEFFKEASSGGVLEDRLLEIWGNPGSGKTALSRIIATRMRSESFYFLAGCPYREHPLHVVPAEERENIFLRWYYFKGELCSACEKKLRDELKGEWKNFPIKKAQYRLSAGIGMLQVEGALPEPKNSGEVPNAWNQIFKLANGGILFIDLPAQPKDLRSMIARFVTDGTLKARDQTDWWPDFAVVSISNKKLADIDASDSTMSRALLDRVVPVTFRLVMDPNAELRIQKKQLAYGRREFHFMPRVMDSFAYLVAVSRLDLSYNVKLKLDGEDALAFYSGDVKLAGDKKTLLTYSYKELRVLRPGDGIQGMTTRDAPRLLTSTGQYHHCVGIQHLLMALRQEAGLEKGIFIGDIQTRTKDWLGPLEPDSSGTYATGLMEKKYQNWIMKDLIHGWIGNSFEKKRDEYFNKYLDHAAADVRKIKPRDESGKEVDVDTVFLCSVEEQIKILNQVDKENFRAGVILLFRKAPFLLANHPPLEEAIINKIVYEYHEQIRLAITGKASDPGKVTLQFEKTKAELYKIGYESCCWDNLLSYARRSIFNEEKK